MRQRDATTGLEPIGVLAHYNLLERLAPSGPGDIYRARDTKRGRTVIIRRLPTGFFDSRTRARTEQAAQALSSHSHPNVLRLFEVGDDSGCFYLVFEHLSGQSLRAELGGRALGVRRALQLAVQMADAVADAHASGYLHGGLSPESVLITARGHAKIPAHALACRYGFDESVSPPRLHDYPAPEEVAGHAPDERSDVFSVGAMLYEMLSGRKPHPRGSAPPSVANRHVSPALDDLVLRAVAPNPDRRYANAAALASDLRTIAAELDATGSPDDEELPPGSPVRRVNLVLVAAAFTLVAAAAWWLTRP